jgi:ABC-2 type transport system permease protein
MIKNFLHDVMTEIGAIFGDQGVLLVMGFAVIFYAFVYPLPYAREVLREVPLVVIDHDNSAVSRQLVRMVDASDLIRVDARVQNLDEARKKIAAGRYSAALVIPVDFEKSLLQAHRATVAAYVDATYFLVYRQAMTGLVKAVRTLSAGIQVRRFQAQGWSEEKARVGRSPLNFVDRPLFNPYLGYATYIVPGVLVLILQQTMLIGIGMISGTRTERSAAGAAPAVLHGGPGMQILSRTVACLALYLIHVLFIYGVAYRIWGFPMHAGFTAVFGFLIPFLLAVVFLGQLLAEFFKTRETAMVMIVWSSLLAVLISGFSWPVETMPHWVRAFAMLIPSTWGISGVLRLTQMGASFQQVQVEWLWLWGLSGLFWAMALVSVRFRCHIEHR